MSFDAPDFDSLPSFENALNLIRGDQPDAPLLTSVAPEFSNGPSGLPHEKGSPFGGLMAALAVKAMQQGAQITAPLRSLSVQFMAPARYNQPVQFEPRLLRAGRTVSYAQVLARQAERLLISASGTFGQDVAWPDPMSDIKAPPPPLSAMKPDSSLTGPMSPHFTRYVEYSFETGPNILGGNIGKAPVERLWMRTRDGAALDDLRLCFLLDALYPPAMTLTRDYMRMTSVDLRYDILCELTPDLAPDGWVFVEYRILEHDHGWSIDDATVWAADGRAIAVARQRRKVL